jgi:hypothetical protein
VDQGKEVVMTRALAEVSFRDPAGFVYRHDGDLRRQVNLVYREHYDRLMTSGLYEDLVEARLLIPHEELATEAWEPDLAYKVIRPEPVETISYPYEWSFSQYRDAALVLLEVQRRALLRGMTLKDASVYNLQFHRGRPVFIDTLSFEVHLEGEPWAAYRQFCEHFLAPLALMALRDHRLNQLCRTNIDGIPLDLAVRLLPARSWLDWGLVLHVRLHERFQRTHTVRAIGPPKARALSVSRNALLGLVDSLASTIRRLRWRPSRGGWASYEEDLPYTPEGYDRKARIVRSFVDMARPRTVWDLGANTGHFSRIAAESGASVVAFDVEPACVERAYLEGRSRDESRILPLVLDLLNPSPPSGWMNRERGSIFERGRPEMAMALALIHHLAFVGNQPMENLAGFFRGLAPRLLIEFVPEDDPQVRLLSAQRGGVHHEYNREAFERCFGQHFLIESSEPVTEPGRTLYLLRRQPD